MSKANMPYIDEASYAGFRVLPRNDGKGTFIAPPMDSADIQKNLSSFAELILAREEYVSTNNLLNFLVGDWQDLQKNVGDKKKRAELDEFYNNLIRRFKQVAKEKGANLNKVRYQSQEQW